MRVIKIPRNDGDYDDYDDLVSSIVRATNWQNAIKPSDLISNDYVQVFLERGLRKRGYQYLRKKQTRAEAMRILGSQGFYTIKKEELAQAIAACEFDPALVRKGKEGLFDERYYRPIFSSRSIPFYLSRCWLMWWVQSTAYGYPERAYAKWLVLHFAWQKLSQDIGYGRGEQNFRYACERELQEVNNPLSGALEGVFRAALAFYRHKRGKGEGAKDVSSFFQLVKLNEQFNRFWTSSKNTHRKKTEVQIKKFRIALKNIEGVQ